MLVVADVVGLSAAFAVTEALTGGGGQGNRLDLASECSFFLAILPLWLIGAKLFGLYDRDAERAAHSAVDDLVRVFALVTVGLFVVSRVAWLTRWVVPEQSKLTLFWATSVPLVACARVLAVAVTKRSTRFRQRAIIVGAGEVGQLIARKLLQHPEYGIKLVGLVDRSPRERRSDLGDLPILSRSLEELPQLVTALDVDRVIFSFSRDGHNEALALLRALREEGVQVDVVPRLFEAIGRKVQVHSAEGIPLLGLPPVRVGLSARLVKRAGDIAGASLLLLLAAPLFALAAVLVRRDSPGPVFFRQVRLGQGMREFTLLKFRTMRDDTDDAAHRAFIAATMHHGAAAEQNGLYKLNRDDAVTGVGRWLRKTSIDELPQLINVLRGEMSLVGPRPCLPYEVERFAPHHFDRFLVPAGLTGLWQVEARARATFGEALDMDALYVQNWSLSLDLSLLMRTPLQLVHSSGTA
jgi:exopolysaccharide biosynthesis polyprenyl glycosylphosphotransferase